LLAIALNAALLSYIAGLLALSCAGQPSLGSLCFLLELEGAVTQASLLVGCDAVSLFLL